MRIHSRGINHNKRTTMTIAQPPPTTDAGIPVPSDEHSLTIGPDGPILLHDHYLIEQIANFDRERIPERPLNTKSGSVFGHFEVAPFLTSQEV
jgi:catalase